MKSLGTAVACLALLLAAGRSHAQAWTTLSPPARCAARMVFDSANARVILFGGTSVYADDRYYSDVWQMPAGNAGYSGWSPLRPAGTPPSGRADCAMVIDPPGNRAIVFGGSPAFGALVNDVWALNLVPRNPNWESLAPSGSPPSARAYPFAAYHPGRRSLIIFGGYASSGAQDDVWELRLDSLAWRQIAVSGRRPPARYDGAAVLDADGDRLLVYGGKAGGTFYGDLWELDLTPGSERWTQLAPSGNPPAERAGFAHAQSGDGRKLYVFGGWAPNFLADLYELDVPSLAWTRFAAGGDVPQPRRNSCGAWDSGNGNFLVYGGECGVGLYLSDASYIHPGSVAVTAPVWQVQTRSNPALFIPTVTARGVVVQYVAPGDEPVQIDIVGVDGRVVRELLRGRTPGTNGSLHWDGTGPDGARVSAGSYFCRLAVGATAVTRRFALVE
ncbi:MAG: kelch repeat-containing protein [bacterium]